MKFRKSLTTALLTLVIVGFSACANLGGMEAGFTGMPNIPQLGLSELTLTAPCPPINGQPGGSAVYRAPFGASTGSVSATCAPSSNGGVTVSVTNGWDPVAMIGAIAPLAMSLAQATPTPNAAAAAAVAKK